MFSLTIVIAIGGMVTYHLLQKSIFAQAHPVASLAITYVCALLATLLLIPLYPIRDSLLGSLRSVTWPSYALGLSVVAIELGFLLAYRAGWSLNVAAGYANVVTILILIPLGLLAFGEPFSTRKLLGVLAAAVAVFLLSE